MCSVLTGGQVSASPNSSKGLRTTHSDEMSEPESNPVSPKIVETQNSERDHDEELSVGSPEHYDQDDTEDNEDAIDQEPNNPHLSNPGQTSLRIFRNKRDQEKDSDESSDESDEDERPLDFTTAKGALENNNATGAGLATNGEEYFMPFKNLEMKASTHLLFKPKPVLPLPPPPPLQRRAGGEDNNDLRGPPSQKRRRGVQSFSIDEILSHKAASLAAKAAAEQEPHHGNHLPQAIVRPWDIETATSGGKSGISSSDSNRRKSMEDSPLDALFQMASKTFEGLKAKSELDPSQLSFASKQPPKKKRKSRTAFTNHQIFELEKRFLYQKYLSPADRDEIAAQLGLTNAQVITWFQNRRAKLKRDMEELRKDVECTSQVIPHALGHQQMAAAAVAALASRRLHNAAGIKFPMDLHRSPPPHMFQQHGLMSMQPPGSNSSSRESLASPHSPIARSDRSDRSPPIRVTDSD